MMFFPFALLVWLSGGLDAQSAAPSCSPPTLDYGYFIPPKVFYPHETHIVYVCEDGYKPPGEGWFTTSTCKNGNWSPEPRCIGQPCVMEPADYPDINLSSTTYMEEGQSKSFPCRMRGYTLYARCNNRTLETTGCCYNDYIQYPGYCVFTSRW
ncbi:complement factor H-like [Cololabis saira]|uniref:complement factor H-like n=1 Tax=Cololabis saira TaxID=129043 RepID=UPI002AD463D7|nr:complement factor H-like [Cololabis saira]